MIAILGGWLAAVSSAADPAVTVHRFARGFIGVAALEGEHGVVLIDTHYPRSTAWLKRRLARAGLLDRISLIVLTHGHSDHAGGAAALRAELGVPVLAGRGDAPILAAGDHGEVEPQSLIARLVKVMVPRHFPPLVPDRLVQGPVSLQPYGVAATVIPVGGHTAGSLVVRLDDGSLALCGDLIRGDLVAHHRPRLHFFHEDPPAAHAAIAALLDDGASTLLPSHGDTLTAERVADWLDSTFAIGESEVHVGSSGGPDASE